MKPARPIVNGSDTAFTGNLKRWGADVVDALGSKSDHPGMRVPFPFEVRRGWETGDSESSWGVHGGAIQVGSTVYKCDVTETLGDGRRWQPIDDPDGKLAESPLDCTIYAGIQGGFVVFSTDPDMDTFAVYATPIAILDGVRLVQLIVGNIRIGDGDPDQFRVVPTDETHIKVRGGVWQFNVRTWDSAYKEVVSIAVPTDSADITWPGDSFHDEALSDSYEVTTAKSLWAKLDRSSVAPVLTLEILASGATPTAAAETYWHKLAELDLVDDEVDIEQIHSGSIRSELDPKTGATTITRNPSTAAADSGTWRSHDNKELTIDRHRIHIDASAYKVTAIKWTETYSAGGRLLTMGAETVVASLDLDPVDITVVTDVNYNTSTGVLKQTKRTAKVLVAGVEGDSTIDTASDCPT